MNVLNTYGGGVDYSVGSIVYGVIEFLLFATLSFVSWRTRDRVWAVSFLLTSLLGAFLIGASVARPEPVPVRHEVTLQPDGVIDATKYTIVEHRGEIYVIEEREADE